MCVRLISIKTVTLPVARNLLVETKLAEVLIMRKVYLTLTILLMLSIAVTGCTKKQEEAAAPSKLSLTINSWIGWAPLYLAKEKKLFGNTDLEITRVEDTGARKSTMISGKVDGYASSVDNFALDSSEGVPGKIVLCFDESYGGDGIVAKQSIRDVKDLKGKQIAFQKGLPSHFLLLTLLDKAGISPTDVKQIDLDADKAGAAFTSGKIDSAVTWEPWISKAAAMADGKILVTTKEYPGLIVDTLVFREQVLKEKKGSVKDILSGWFKALDYWKSHKDEADAIMAKSYGLKVEEFRDMCGGVRFFDLTKNQQYFGASDANSPINAVFQSASLLWQKAGVMKGGKSPADAIDATFIREMK